MIKNYIKIAIRTLINQSFYSFINISGLTVSLCCFILISLYVNDELNYDKHFHNPEDIYRLDFSGDFGGEVFSTALASAPAAEALLNEFPEVVDATRFRNSGTWLVGKAKKNYGIKIEDVSWADKNVFSFFGIQLKYGDVNTTFENPKSLALNATKAEAIFGDTNPIGEIVILDNDPENQYVVSAVYEDLPRDSHFRFEMLLNLEALEESNSLRWLSINFSTYVRLNPTANPKDLEAKFPDLAKKYIGDELEQLLNLDREILASPNSPAKFSLFPMLDIHLKSDKTGELGVNSDEKYVYIFTAIALFILLLACINFMNLATARSTKRAKEVGLRKVMGAYKNNLINQFLAEALVISVISTFLSIVLAILLLPYFNELAGKSINENVFLNPLFLIALLIIAILVGILAGSYPAFYLSKYNPIDTLKGKLNLGLKSAGIRSTLVVFQFLVSITVIIGTAVIYDQLSYMQNKKLGFDKEHIIMIKDVWLLDDDVDIFKNSVKKNTNIINGTISSFLPINNSLNNNVFFTGSNPATAENHLLSNNMVDHDFISTMGIEVLEGRNFSKEFVTDSTALIINETAAKLLKLADPIGKSIYSFYGSREKPVLEARKIIGVMKDFHYASLRNNIGPLVFELGKQETFASFKIKGDKTKETIAFIEKKWDEISQGQPFDYDFLDQQFSDMYDSELKIGNICGVFALLAIFIACLGLYGLAAFTTEQKTKEIGIRKVLGASNTSIITMISKEFAKLIMIAFLVASVLTYFLMENWLQDFEYRTDLKATTFLLGGFLAMIVALLTMGFQSYRAAKMNPTKSLRSD